MGTPTKIARAIRDKGADYVLALKGNQSRLHDDVARYSDAARLPITADGGGNGSRLCLWKREPQCLAPMSLASTPSTTCRLAPASGIKSRIACSRTSR
jgi:hypothetical protein